MNILILLLGKENIYNMKIDINNWEQYDDIDKLPHKVKIVKKKKDLIKETNPDEPATKTEIKKKKKK